jgi:hypothetical protein
VRTSVQGTRLVRVVEAEARLAATADQPAAEAQFVALEVGEVPVPVRLRADEVKRRAQCEPARPDELRRAHGAAESLSFDYERRLADVVHCGAEDEQQPVSPRDDGDAEWCRLV